MKSTGIVRRVDELGPIVIPKELRKILAIEEKDSLEIYVDCDRVILKKYQAACTCVFCDNDEDVISHKGKLICKHCLELLINQVA